MRIRKFENALFTTAEDFPIIFWILNKITDETTQIIINIIRHVYIVQKFKPKILIKIIF